MGRQVSEALSRTVVETVFDFADFRADPELLRQYMATRHYRYVRNATRTGWFSPVGGNFHDLANVAAALGVEKPGPQSEAVAA